MSEVRTAYAVASGDYSDHHIWCLFETREDAETYCQAWREAETERQKRIDGEYFDETYISTYDEPSIEEYQLWAGVPNLRISEGGWDIERVVE